MIDPDGRKIMYTTSLFSGKEIPDWMTFHTRNRTLNGLSPRKEAIYEFKLFGYDGGPNIPLELSFKITVRLQNFTAGFFVMGLLIVVFTFGLISFLVSVTMLKVTSQEMAKMGLNKSDFFDHMMEQAKERVRIKRLNKMQNEVVYLNRKH